MKITVKNAMQIRVVPGIISWWKRNLACRTFGIAKRKNTFAHRGNSNNK